MKNPKKLLSSLNKLTLSLLAGGLMVNALPTGAAPTGQNAVIGYYFIPANQINNYTESDPAVVPFPVSRITPERARQLTHINFSFLDINAQGECAWDPAVDTQKAKDVVGRLSALKQHNPALRIMYSVGGWYYSNDIGPSHANYVKSVATPEARKHLAQSCVKVMKDYGFDGIDIDWEYPQNGEVENFAIALKEMRTLLDQSTAADGRQAKPYQLTIAGAGGAFYLSRYYHHLPQIVAPLDYINLMTYDLAGPWEKQTNHHAALFGDPAGPSFYNALRESKLGWSWEEVTRAFPSPFYLTVDAAIQQHLLLGNVPASKIVMGVPFYGRAFKDVGNGDHGQYGWHGTPGGDPYPSGDVDWLVGCTECAKDEEPRVAAYRQLKNMIDGNFGYERRWNNLTKTPYLYHAKNKLFVTYDDAESFKYKAKYIKEKSLGGVMFWHLGQDDNQGSLLDSLHTYLNDPSYDDSGVDLGNGERYAGVGPGNLPVLQAPAWQAVRTYNAGEKASYQGFVWQAKWQTADAPSAGTSSAWQRIGRADGNQQPGQNRPPVAQISGKTTAAANEAVELSAAKSSDPDGDKLTFKWKVPAGIDERQDGAILRFTAPRLSAAKAFKFEVEVSDGKATARKQHTVTVQAEVAGNRPPVAHISGKTTAAANEAVELSAAKSSDPDGDALTFKWKVPAGIEARQDGAILRFTAPRLNAAKAFAFEVEVSDGKATARKQHTVAVQAANNGGDGDSHPAYQPGHRYNGGEIVSHNGKTYRCKPFPFSGWCGQAPAYYAPGTGTVWTDAWEPYTK